MGRIKRILTSKKTRFACLSWLGLYNWMNDVKYLKRKYSLVMGKELELENPKTFNEKLQWLKLYDRKDVYTRMVDKNEVKRYVADKIGGEYVIPTLGVYERFDDIDFNKLPDQFVIKCTHDSGGLVIVKDKNKFNKAAARKKINKSLKRNYYYMGREWPYKNVKPRIIIEKYMKDARTEDLTDFKVMCFNGKAKIIFTCTERFGDGLKVTFYDLDWNRMPFERHYPASKTPIPKPKRLEEMIVLSEKLAKDIPFVRIDWYEIDGKLYFGEYTFYPGSGMEEFTPSEWDEKLGSWIRL